MSVQVQNVEVDFTDPEAGLRKYLELTREMLKRTAPEGFAYSSQTDFLLQHGRFYKPRPLPAKMWKGPPRVCYGNAIILGAVEEFRYVEGIAIPKFTKSDSGFPVEHAWNADAEGGMYDATWDPVGLVYFGVEFSVERADDATWNGDACVLNDYQRKHPLFRTRWTGEDFGRLWPRSRRLEVIRRNYKAGNWRSYPSARPDFTPKEFAAKVREMLDFLETEKQGPEAMVVYTATGATAEDIAEVRRHLTDAENAHVKIEAKE